MVIIAVRSGTRLEKLAGLVHLHALLSKIASGEIRALNYRWFHSQHLGIFLFLGPSFLWTTSLWSLLTVTYFNLYGSLKSSGCLFFEIPSCWRIFSPSQKDGSRGNCPSCRKGNACIWSSASLNLLQILLVHSCLFSSFSLVQALLPQLLRIKPSVLLVSVSWFISLFPLRLLSFGSLLFFRALLGFVLPTIFASTIGRFSRLCSGVYLWNPCFFAFRLGLWLELLNFMGIQPIDKGTDDCFLLGDLVNGRDHFLFGYFIFDTPESDQHDVAEHKLNHTPQYPSAVRRQDPNSYWATRSETLCTQLCTPLRFSA